MSDQTFRITGRVIDRPTRLGLARLPVEAWGKHFIHSDLAGSAVTDEGGAFRIAFSASHFRKLLGDRQPYSAFSVRMHS